jgi:hypothetical protein
VEHRLDKLFLLGMEILLSPGGRKYAVEKLSILSAILTELSSGLRTAPSTTGTTALKFSKLSPIQPLVKLTSLTQLLVFSLMLKEMKESSPPLNLFPM